MVRVVTEPGTDVVFIEDHESGMELCIDRESAHRQKSDPAVVAGKRFKEITPEKLHDLLVTWGYITYNRFSYDVVDNWWYPHA